MILRQAHIGKAFEFACLDALNRMLSANQDVLVESSLPLDTAFKFFNNTTDLLRGNLVRAADAAARVVVRLEPQLEYPSGNIPLRLSIQTDSRGMEGDVRDVLCLRKQNDWEIGLSCKHNHRAVKHSRLSPTIDFGAEWFGIPCSRDYFAEITPLFDELKQMRDNSGALWSGVNKKRCGFMCLCLMLL